MRQTEFSGDQVSRQVQQTFKLSDQERTEQLGKFSTLQNTRLSLLQKERERLMEKYRTPTHPRIQKIDAKLRITSGLNQEFQTEFEKSQMDVTPFDRKTWRVQGFVFNSQGEGIAGLNVSLFDQKGKQIQAIDSACTNERGYFLIDYPSNQTKPTVPADQPLFLTVTTQNCRVLHQEKTPLFVQIGVINYREIKLNSSKKNDPIRVQKGSNQKL